MATKMLTNTEQLLCPICMTYLLESGPLEEVRYKKCCSCGYARPVDATYCRPDAHSPTEVQHESE